jgi:ArsR family transcriptional regulator
VIEPNTLFSALSNNIRLRCLMLLAVEGELCVCEFTYALELSQPAVSRHLALLREARIVLDRREGLWIHYRLHPDLPQWVFDALHATANGISGQSPFVNDRKLLADMPSRPGAPRCA